MSEEVNNAMEPDEELARAVDEAYAEGQPEESARAGEPEQGAPEEAAAPAADSLETEADTATAVASLTDDLARSRADLYNLQQEYNAFVRRTRTEIAAARTAGAAEVIEALIPVLDDLHLARQHGDLTGPFGAIADKLEATLAQRHGFSRYGEAGDEFDPTQHEALVASPNPEVQVDTVNQVLQPGYRAHDRVLRAARVAVHTPEQ